MVSKTRKRQLRRSNLENDSFRINETPVETARTEDSRQNVNDVLTNIDINTVIREAVQKELNKLGVVSNVNRQDDVMVQSSSKTNPSNDENAIRCRTTHEAAGNSRTDLNRSVRDGCPDSSVLARHNQIEPGADNRHMATEMGLPQNGNPNAQSATQDRRQSRKVPEFLTGNSLHNMTNDVMNSTMIEHSRVNRDRVSSITRLADAITSRLPEPNATPLIKPVTTSTLTFDGKNEKFELFEDWFNTLIKMQPGITEAMKINQFHAHLRKDALQTFHNMNSSNKNRLEDILVVFRRKYVKPESVATAKHKWHKLTFDPNTQSLPDFLEELHQGAEKAFGENANQMINSLLYAKLPPHLKRSVNTAYLENGTYEEIVQHLERELELNGLEGENAPAITISTTQNTPAKVENRAYGVGDLECRYCKEKGHFVRECEKLKKKKERDQRDGIPPRERRTFPPCDHCGLTNHSSERCRRISNRNNETRVNNDAPSTSRSQPTNSATTVNASAHLN